MVYQIYGLCLQIGIIIRLFALLTIFLIYSFINRLINDSLHIYFVYKFYFIGLEQENKLRFHVVFGKWSKFILAIFEHYN
jgi:hypothetical protein